MRATQAVRGERPHDYKKRKGRVTYRAILHRGTAFCDKCLLARDALLGRILCIISPFH